MTGRSFTHEPWRAVDALAPDGGDRPAPQRVRGRSRSLPAFGRAFRVASAVVAIVAFGAAVYSTSTVAVALLSFGLGAAAATGVLTSVRAGAGASPDFHRAARVFRRVPVGLVAGSRRSSSGELLNGAHAQKNGYSEDELRGRPVETVVSARSHDAWREGAGTRPLADKKKIGLTLRAETAAPFFTADDRKLRHIVTNLVANAINFTPAGGKSDVAVRVSRIECCVRVADDGPGIAPVHHERIFREFESVDDSLSRSGEGTGLGLALARRLAELHGGTLTVESELGGGAGFTLRGRARAGS